MVEFYICKNGDKYWYLDEQGHRANGPSIMLISGVRWWFWNGQQVTEYEHMMLVAQARLHD